jgi:hypothetical protein
MSLINNKNDSIINLKNMDIIHEDELYIKFRDE